MKVFDAHVHFPMKEANPYERLKAEIKVSGVSRIMLIVNGEEESRLFWKYADAIEAGDLGVLVNIAVLLDIDFALFNNVFDRLENRGWNYAIKIHPRLSNIRRKDIDAVSERLECLSPKPIIVDNWIYGPRIENHVGTELSIRLAEKFNDRMIVMAHSGGVRILETMLLTRSLKNIYYDLSETCRYFIGTSVQNDIIHFIKYTKDRLMYGSDYPDFSITSSVKTTEDEMEAAGLTVQEKENIFYNTGEMIYGGGISPAS